MYNSKQTVSLFLISAIIWWEQIKCHEEFLLTVVAIDTVFSAIVTYPVNFLVSHRFFFETEIKLDGLSQLYLKKTNGPHAARALIC